MPNASQSQLEKSTFCNVLSSSRCDSHAEITPLPLLPHLPSLEIPSGSRKNRRQRLLFEGELQVSLSVVSHQHNDGCCWLLGVGVLPTERRGRLPWHGPQGWAHCQSIVFLS